MIGMKRHDLDRPSDKPLDLDRVEDIASGSDAVTKNEGQRLAKEVLEGRKPPATREMEQR